MALWWCSRRILSGVRKPLQVAGLAACLVAGMLLATAVVGSVQAAGTSTIETTSEPTTVVTTETVEQTTTRQIILPSTTTTTSSSSGETPAWVWVLLAILAVGLIIVIALLARRGGGDSGVSAAERRGRLDVAVAGWTAQGWALESQSADSAVLQRAGDRMIVSVDGAGRVSTQPYAVGPPS